MFSNLRNGKINHQDMQEIDNRKFLFQSHLLLLILWIISASITYVIKFLSHHSFWDNISFNTLMIAGLIIAYHMISIIRVQVFSARKKSLESLIASLRIIHILFQKLALLGLGLIVIGLWITKTTSITAMGIVALFVFTIEYIVLSWKLWNYDEDLRRAQS